MAQEGRTVLSKVAIDHRQDPAGTRTDLCGQSIDGVSVMEIRVHRVYKLIERNLPLMSGCRRKWFQTNRSSYCGADCDVMLCCKLCVKSYV